MRKVPSHPPAHLHAPKMSITTYLQRKDSLFTIEDKNKVYEKISLLNPRDSLIKRSTV